jgi:phosphoglycolate phosphatase
VTPTLVLWDIDHTLLTTGRWGRRLYEVAFQAMTGETLRAVADMAGRTEHAILHDTLALHGIAATADVLPAWYAAIAAAGHNLRAALADEGGPLPGAADALRRFATAGAAQSVVTGNLRPIALIKLEAFGLHADLDLDLGGYGSLSADRAVLVEAAWRLANARAGHPYPAERVFVIGDTAHDIRGALAVGVRAVGVATGRTPAADLVAASAELVLTDLRDTGTLAAAVLG